VLRGDDDLRVLGDHAGAARGLHHDARRLERPAHGEVAARPRGQDEQHDEDDRSSPERHGDHRMTAEATPLFASGRRERDDVVEARVVGAPRATRLAGE